MKFQASWYYPTQTMHRHDGPPRFARLMWINNEGESLTVIVPRSDVFAMIHEARIARALISNRQAKQMEDNVS